MAPLSDHRPNERMKMRKSGEIIDSAGYSHMQYIKPDEKQLEILASIARQNEIIVKALATTPLLLVKMEDK